LGAAFSLGNLPPWSLSLWPVQAADLAGAVCLLIAFTAAKKATNRLTREMAKEGISPANYTVFITKVPADLGASAETYERAVHTYSRFFSMVCARPASGKFGVPPPDDSSISEIHFIKDSSEWLRVRRKLAEAEEAERAATMREVHVQSAAKAHAKAA
jgi:hypothetical protein